MNIDDDLMKFISATLALIASVHRALILQAVLMAIIGTATAFNFWMLRRTLKLTRELIEIIKDDLTK